MHVKICLRQYEKLLTYIQIGENSFSALFTWEWISVWRAFMSFQAKHLRYKQFSTRVLHICLYNNLYVTAFMQMTLKWHLFSKLDIFMVIIFFCNNSKKMAVPVELSISSLVLFCEVGMTSFFHLCREWQKKVFFVILIWLGWGSYTWKQHQSPDTNLFPANKNGTIKS